MLIPLIHSGGAADSGVCCMLSVIWKKKEGRSKEGRRDEASKGGVSLLSLLPYSTEIVIRRISFFDNVVFVNAFQ